MGDYLREGAVVTVRWPSIGGIPETMSAPWIAAESEFYSAVPKWNENSRSARRLPAPAHANQKSEPQRDSQRGENLLGEMGDIGLHGR